MLLSGLRRRSWCLSFSLWLCGLYCGALRVLKSCLTLCPRVLFSFLLALGSPRLEKKELVYVILVHLFVCFASVSICPFCFPLGVGGWLRFVSVALPGLFYLLF